MRKRKSRLALAAAAMLGLLAAPGAIFAANVDTVYHNGKIYTMDDLKSGNTYDFSKAKDLNISSIQTVEVVAAKDGKIVFAGSRADAEAQGMMDAARVVDLQGRAMLPGLIDGHGHFPSQGTDDLYTVFLGSPPLGTMTSIADYQEALNTACQNAKEGDGVNGTGYDDTLIEDMRHPTWMDIEAAPACQGKDVLLNHISGHVRVASKSLLIKGGLMNDDGTPTELGNSISGVVQAGGIVTGVLMETLAMNSVPSPTITQDSQKALARANDVFLAKGVTMADVGGAMLMSGVAANVTMQTGLANGNLTLRTNLHPILNAAYGGAGNLMSLYWQGITNPMATSAEMVSSGFAPSAMSPKIGADITKMAMALTPQFTPDPNLPDEYIFLGAYKILGDGSPQAYTAWMKDPGNYDWGDYTADDRFAMYPDALGQKPLLGTKYDTTENSAAPTPPPYFNGLAGTVNVYPQDLQNLLEVVHRAGHSTEIHTNGSAYAEAWIEALERAVSKHPEIKDTRHTAIHAQTFERNILERMSGNYATVNKEMTTQLFGALGQPDRGQPGSVFDSSAVNGMTEAQLSDAMKAQNLFSNYFVTHTYYYGERHRDIFFGPGRANNISPVGWSIALGVPYAFHNDNDVTPIEPLQSVESAVTRLSAKSLVSPGGQLISGTGHDIDATVTLPGRKDASGPIPGSEMKFYNYDQRINGAQAFIGVTIGPAYQNKIENRVGSIAAGKLADFVIMDDDPIQLAEKDPTRLSDIRITSTIVGDNVRYGLLPGSAEYYFNVRPSYAPDPSISNDVTISNLSAQPYQDASQLVATGQDQVRYAAFTVSGDIANAGVATIQMHILGNGSRADQFHLYINGQDAAYGMSPEAGHFWLCAADAPTIQLEPSQVLAMNKDYAINFTLAASDSSAARDAGNSFADRIELIADGVAPTNRSSILPSSGGNSSNDDDDDSSGCTVGNKPIYDFGILAAMLLGIVGLRSLRRRSGSR